MVSMQTSQSVVPARKDMFSVEIKLAVGMLPRPLMPSLKRTGKHRVEQSGMSGPIRSTQASFNGTWVGGRVRPSNGGEASIRIARIISQPSPSDGSLSHWKLTYSASSAAVMESGGKRMESSMHVRRQSKVKAMERPCRWSSCT